MKKRTFFLITLMTIISMLFVSCGKKNSDPEIYTVTFNSNGGSNVEAIDVEEGTTISLPSNPTKTGYTFEGWFVDESLETEFDETTAIEKDITLYAKWNVIPAKFTVSFESNGGSAIESQTVENGKNAQEPTEPKKDGVNFGGWYTDATCENAFEFSTPITANITLYAKWTEDPVYSVTIKYNITGEKDGEAKATKDKEYKITEPTKNRDGYTVKWYSDESCTKEFDFKKALSDNATIYAKWTAIEYTITYIVGDNATEIPSAKYTVEDEITLPVPTAKQGYYFAAWYTEETYESKITKIEKGSTGDKSVYAKITTYKVLVPSTTETKKIEDNYGGFSIYGGEGIDVETGDWILLAASFAYDDIGQVYPQLGITPTGSDPVYPNLPQFYAKEKGTNTYDYFTAYTIEKTGKLTYAKFNCGKANGTGVDSLAKDTEVSVSNLKMVYIPKDILSSVLTYYKAEDTVTLKLDTISNPVQYSYSPEINVTVPANSKIGYSYVRPELVNDYKSHFLNSDLGWKANYPSKTAGAISYCYDITEEKEINWVQIGIQDALTDNADMVWTNFQLYIIQDISTF